jgi:hypothetical protein
MTLHGLPDFDQPIQADGFELFYPFEGGDAVLLPDQLQVATSADGSPDFALEMVRRLGRFAATDAYGRLDLRVAPRDRLADALTVVRDVHPGATVRQAMFAGGFIRLELLQLPGEAPVELPSPARLAPNGLVTQRMVLNVMPPLAALIKGALQGELLALTVVAELALLGVSPRLPLTTAFNPAVLLAPLLVLAGAQRRIMRSAVVDFFRQDPAALPLQLSSALPGDATERFAQAMADRVLARFGTFVAAPGEQVCPTFALPAPEQIPDGSFVWDLAEPSQALRPVVLRLDPLTTARDLVHERGLAAVYREITVPAFPTGVLPVTVLANLPDQRPGVLEIGVTLNAPPRPPQRPQAAIATATLAPPDDCATLALTLGVGAAPEYRYTTYAVLMQDDGVNRLETSEREHSGGWLSLGPDDFPVGFATVAADRVLLDQATLHGTLVWGAEGAQSSRSFALDRDAPALALALPQDAANATITVEARARQGERTLRLGPLPAGHLQLGLYSFAEYGPHTVAVTCAFDDASEICVIELLPEDSSDSDGPIALLVFTPDRPTKPWTWFARTPFAPGYRYRPRPALNLSKGREPGAEVASWSDVRSPFEPLNIRATEITENTELGV